MMWTLTKLFFDICCFTKAPQDIPYSQTLLKVLILVYALAAFLALWPDTGTYQGLLEVALEIILMMAFVWGILLIYRKSSRYTQVLCAFLGTDALISFLALPVMAALVRGYMSDLATIIMLSLMTWHWVVCGHILRHALSQPLLFGLGVAFLYIFGSYQMMTWLFPFVPSG